MNDDMSLEDAAKVLSDRWHGDSKWEAIGRGYCLSMSQDRVLTDFEAKAVAREYLRLDGKLKAAVGPDATAVMAWLASGIEGYTDDARIGLPNASYINVGQVRAFLAEHDAAAQEPKKAQ